MRKCFLTKRTKNGKSIFDILTGKNDTENYIYTLAEAHAIDLIAKTISKCEIQVFAKNKDKKIEETKNDTYWRLNIQPNYNENGTMFLYKLAVKLLTNKRALIIINRDADKSKLLYVADDFVTSKSILYGKTFSDISISDNEGNSIKIEKIYNAENAIYYSINNDRLKTASENFKDSSKKILKAVDKGFIQSNLPKWRLKNPGGQAELIDIKTKKPIDYNTYKTAVTEGLLSEEEAIILLSEMFELTNLNKDNKQDFTNNSSVIKEIGDTVARNWNIPLSIFYGNKTEKSTGNDDFITFAVDQYFELLEDGFNIGLVGKKDYLKGEYIQFNRTNINHKDIIDSANGIDKLTADGFSRNEINKLLRLPKIDETWANEHNITKNYANVKEGENNNGE